MTITPANLLEATRQLLECVADSESDPEEAAFQFRQRNATLGGSRTERLLCLLQLAFDPETTRHMATAAVVAARDELRALSTGLEWCRLTAGAFQSHPVDIVLQSLDADDFNPGALRDLRHAEDCDSLAGLPLTVYASALPTVIINWPAANPTATPIPPSAA